jgi:hypothetical protein
MLRSGISTDREYLWRNPGPVRRLVLLERATYRPLTCDRSVLDVGVEAGYS